MQEMEADTDKRAQIQNVTFFTKLNLDARMAINTVTI